MAIKRSEELFGDDGAHGPRAPISTTAGPGLGPDNRAVAYGEDLTSFTANRAVYALALNDDDLDLRVRVFEESGLDGVYRLGSINVAGGGRRIRVDGGAVEGWTELGESYATDVSNAVFRANLLSDTQNGSVGLDVASRVTAPGAALFGLLDRRALVLGSVRTVFVDMQPALLNQNNAGPDTITLLETGRFSQGDGGATDILVGIDLIEVIAGPHRGVYLVRALVSERRAQLLGLGGQAPVFSTDTEVLARLFRPVVSVAGASGASRLSHGLRVVGLPGDDEAPLGIERGALELVPGGRLGGASVVAQEGLRYALRTEVRGALPDQVGYSGSISAAGGFEARALDSMNPEQVLARRFGWPGYRYEAPADSGLAPVGYLAHNQRPTGQFYAHVAANDDGFERTGTLAAGDRIDFAPQVVYAGLYFTMAHPGALLQLTINGADMGMYRVHRSAYATPGPDVPLSVWLRHLDGGVPALGPIGGAVAVRLYSSMLTGRLLHRSATTTDPTGTPHVSAVEISGPARVETGEVPVALQLQTHAQAGGYLLRAAHGNHGSLFAVESSGKTWAKQLDADVVNTPVLQAETSIVATRVYPEPRTYTVAIPQALWKGDRWWAEALVGEAVQLVEYGWGPRTSGAVPGGAALEQGYSMHTAWGPGSAKLRVPITGVVPYGAVVTAIRLFTCSIRLNTTEIPGGIMGVVDLFVVRDEGERALEEVVVSRTTLAYPWFPELTFPLPSDVGYMTAHLLPGGLEIPISKGDALAVVVANNMHLPPGGLFALGSFTLSRVEVTYVMVGPEE